MRIPRVLSLVLVAVMLLTYCLQAMPLGVMAQTTEPTIVVSDAIATAGTAKITIGLQNNPGVISMQLKVKFNTQLLTLLNVVDAGVLGNVFHNPSYGSPYILSWVNDTAPANFTANGTIATLEFAVADSVSVGTVIPVEVTYDYNNFDIYDYYAQPVRFAVDNGSVVSSGVSYGDVDSDGEITSLDALEVLRATVGKDTLTTNQMVAADVNGDGMADAIDALYILKRVVGEIDKFPVE